MTELPVFAVRNAVLFPGSIVPFDVGRRPSLAAVAHAQTGAPALLLVVAQKNPETEEPLESELHSVGCTAEIMNRVPHVNGCDRVILHGQARVILRGLTQVEPYLSAKVSAFPADAP